VPTPTPVVPSSSRLPSDVAIGNSAGDLPIVRVFAADGTLKSTLMPFASSFRGGVRTAVADFDGDGIGDIAVATGPGGAPHVKVIRGSDGAELLSFYAYDPSFSGGVFVAAGDVNGDGIPDIVTGTGAGSGPHVRAFDGRTGAELLSFFAYDPSFRGGVRVAVGDIDGDGRNDIVTTPEFGAPHVKAFGGPGLREIRSFFAYDSAFLGGVSLAVADVDSDGFGDILTGIAANGPSHTKLFDGRTGAERASFFAYDPAYDGGEQVAFVRSGGRAKIVTVSRGPAHTRIFDALTLGENASFYAQRDGLPSVTL